jgi:hypothetical protein
MANKLDQDKYTLSREELKNVLRRMANDGRMIEAIKLVRAVTGWGLKESKDYVESGMYDEYGLGDRVTTRRTGEEVHTITSIVKNKGVLYYWLQDSAGNPCTYTDKDIVRLVA